MTRYHTGVMLDSTAIIRQLHNRQHGISTEPQTSIRSDTGRFAWWMKHHAAVGIFLLLMFEAGVLVGWLNGGIMP